MKEPNVASANAGRASRLRSRALGPAWLRSFGGSTNADFDNETWVIETGDRIIQKEARFGGDSLTPWERLVYCLWVADYMMRNAGDFANAVDMYPGLQTDASRLAEQLSLAYTRETFALPQAVLQREYFNRFVRVCDEIKAAEPPPADASRG